MGEIPKGRRRRPREFLDIGVDPSIRGEKWVLVTK